MWRNAYLRKGSALFSVGLLAAVLWGWSGLIAFATVIGLVLVVRMIEQKVVPVVPEQAVAVVFNRERRALARLLWPGRRLVIPLLEEVTALLYTGPDTVTETTSDIPSADGIPHTVDWTVAFQVAPENIPPDDRSGVVLLLVQDVRKLVRTHVHDCMRLVLGRHPANELCGGQRRGYLERELRDEIRERLWRFGFSVHRVLLGAISPPSDYQQSLIQAQRRRVESQAEIDTVSALQRAIHAFTDTDMQRLTELERQRLLGQNGVTLVYPLASLLNGHSNHPEVDGHDNNWMDGLRLVESLVRQIAERYQERSSGSIGGVGRHHMPAKDDNEQK